MTKKQTASIEALDVFFGVAVYLLRDFNKKLRDQYAEKFILALLYRFREGLPQDYMTGVACDYFNARIDDFRDKLTSGFFDYSGCGMDDVADVYLAHFANELNGEWPKEFISKLEGDWEKYLESQK